MYVPRAIFTIGPVHVRAVQWTSRGEGAVDEESPRYNLTPGGYTRYFSFLSIRSAP